jgi:putative tryptophan/tyrosine transport system substrate-binding protein
MRESCTYGTVRGASSNGGPYRVRRREFIVGLGATVLPIAARGQQPGRMRRIGVLITGLGNVLDDSNTKSLFSAFTQALAGLGWTDGRNVRIDIRGATAADTNQTRAVAQELVGLQPDVILAYSTPATVPLQRETRTIPIVFVTVSDPVASGIVASLNRPGGNITGFANYEASLGGKWVELLSEIVPGLKRVTIMYNPDTSPLSALPSFELAARALKVEPNTALVHSDLDIEAAIIALGREPGNGLVVMPDVFAFAHRALIILAAARNKVPAVYPLSEFVRDGGLLSYGLDTEYSSRLAATYVDRILRGEKPGDLPVQFPTKLEMIVNLKTAKALGLTIPTNLLATADEVIQ